MSQCPFDPKLLSPTPIEPPHCFADCCERNISCQRTIMINKGHIPVSQVEELIHIWGSGNVTIDTDGSILVDETGERGRRIEAEHKEARRIALLPKVFIAHDDGRFDFTDAGRFGNIVTVSESLTDSTDFYPDTVDAKMPAMVAKARNALQDFRPDRDFLCMVGSPVMQALCCFILGQNQRERRQPIRILRFDKQHQQYYPVTL